ncbi:MAG: rod shape-determining protein MreC [Hyphomicrobiales bacterium]|nr:rod shape-determining protein MreC [Hyphomicrobiales bacterium]
MPSPRIIGPRHRHSRAAALILPLRLLLNRFLVFIYIAFAFTVLITSKINPGLLQDTRAMLVDVAAPVWQGIQVPVDALGTVKQQVTSLVMLHQENARLRVENQRLQAAQTTVVSLQNENAQLRQVLHAAPTPSHHYVTARVLGGAASPFAQNVVIDAGKEQGVQTGHAVQTSQGLIGRVVNAGQHSARVLLMTDAQSRIPVRLGASGVPAVAVGMHTDALALSYLPEHATIQTGELVTTSGEGGLLPPGLPVGRVVQGENSHYHVQPFADHRLLNYATVIIPSPQ